MGNSPRYLAADSYWLATLNSNVTLPISSRFQVGILTVRDVTPLCRSTWTANQSTSARRFISSSITWSTPTSSSRSAEHAFYDNRPQITINGRPQPNPTYGQVVTVSRYDETNVALQTSQGTTFSGRSSDSSDWSIGGSVTANAGGSVAAGFGDVDKVEASVDVAAKVGYDYNQNQDNYNSNYSERTLTQTEQTDHDDKLLGRLQTFDVWRYRVYGVSVTDAQGQPANAFL